LSKAAELKEQAAAKFAEAAALVEGKEADSLDEETETKFNAIMQEAKGLDEQFVKTAGLEGTFVQLKDRLDFYSQKAGKGPLPFQSVVTEGRDTGQIKSLGQLFVESETYQELKASGNLESDRASFKTAPFRAEVKAPTDVIGSGAGPGGALVTPDYLPGIRALPQRPLTVRDLFSQDTTGSDSLSYARQTAFDDAAAAVAQATATPASGAKPQSSIAWARVTSPIETIATFMAATRRQLADAGQTRSLIDNQGRLMLQLEEEDQLMNGNGTTPNLQGLNTLAGVQTLTVAASPLAADIANINAIRTAKRMIRVGASRASADAVVMNPTDSEQYDLTRDAEGRYRVGSPFGGAPGDGEAPIWRLRRVETEVVTAATVWVGGFKQGATVFEREGITVLTSDSHADFFVRNLIAVLFEERLGVAWFFPTAFVKITLKTW
jgi:HK97 family phage major capsid protein